jgi:hypothetical protein
MGTNLAVHIANLYLLTFEYDWVLHLLLHSLRPAPLLLHRPLLRRLPPPPTTTQYGLTCKPCGNHAPPLTQQVITSLLTSQQQQPQPPPPASPLHPVQPPPPAPTHCNRPLPPPLQPHQQQQQQPPPAPPPSPAHFCTFDTPGNVGCPYWIIRYVDDVLAINNPYLPALRLVTDLLPCFPAIRGIHPAVLSMAPAHSGPSVPYLDLRLRPPPHHDLRPHHPPAG